MTKADASQSKQKDHREIVKIQVAASPDDTPYPMLVYNADPSLKMFIHPDPQDDGYQKIWKWIVNEGSGGVLGSSGGTKAYFYSRLMQVKEWSKCHLNQCVRASSGSIMVTS